MSDNEPTQNVTHFHYFVYKEKARVQPGSDKTINIGDGSISFMGDNVTSEKLQRVVDAFNAIIDNTEGDANGAAD